MSRTGNSGQTSDKINTKSSTAGTDELLSHEHSGNEHKAIPLEFASRWIEVNIDRLQHHPKSMELYGTSETYVDALVQSISKVGLNNPLFVNERMQVLDGNERLRAIKKLGIKKVRITTVRIRAEHEPEAMVLFNLSRRKMLHMLHGEIKVLYAALSVGRGHRTDIRKDAECGNHDVYARIASFLDRSRSEIIAIVKIGNIRPDYFEMIDQEKLSLSKAAANCQIYEDAEKKGLKVSEEDIEKLHIIKNRDKSCYNLVLDGNYSVDEGIAIINRKRQEVPRPKPAITGELDYCTHCKDCEYKKSSGEPLFKISFGSGTDSSSKTIQKA